AKRMVATLIGNVNLMSAAVGDQAFCQLLMSRLRLRIECLLHGMIGEGAQRKFSRVNSPAEFAVPTLVALLAQTRQFFRLQNIGSPKQGASKSVDSRDVRQIEIVGVHRLAA